MQTNTGLFGAAIEQWKRLQMGKRNSNLPTMLQRVQLRRGEIFQRAQRRFRFTYGQLVVRRFHDSEIKKKEK